MRISREQMFIEMARVASKRSTCFRLNVGAIVVVNNNVVAIGYNGPATGEPHCLGNSCTVQGKGCHRAVHAEMNAMSRVPEELLTAPKTLYVTHSPCPHCMKKLVDQWGSSLRCVVFEAEYRMTDHLHEFWDAGVGVCRLTPSGYLVDHRTNEVLNDL